MESSATNAEDHTPDVTWTTNLSLERCLKSFISEASISLFRFCQFYKNCAKFVAKIAQLRVKREFCTTLALHMIAVFLGGLCYG